MVSDKRRGGEGMDGVADPIEGDAQAAVLKASDGSVVATFEDLLEAECDISIRKALDDRATYASLAMLSRRIATDYKDRAVYELIQNAHDAHPADGDGAIVVRLIKSSDGKAELHVANRGEGFTWPNVEAVRRPARSTKKFGDGIGNKGLGFRSVHVLSDMPEIYSCAGTGSPRPRFDGFCFRFASDAEAAALLEAQGASGALVQEMVRGVPRSLLTRALREQSAVITRYAKEGFATVVRIPLEDAAALASAERQVRDLLEPEAPPTLFLERIRRLGVFVEEEGKRPDGRTMERRTDDLGPICSLEGARFETVRSGTGGYLVARYVVPRDQLVEAIQASLTFDERLETWLESEEDTVVMLACTTETSEPKAGRLYCFLPLEKGQAAPLLGHLNAPFLVRLNRKSLEEGIPLNDFLFSMCARLAVGAAREVADRNARGEKFHPYAGVDLVGWEAEKNISAGDERIAEVCLGEEELGAQALLPLAGGRWGTIATACQWTATGSLFKAQKLAETMDAPLLDPKLGEERRRRIEGLAWAVSQRVDLNVGAKAAAEWVVGIAAQLAKKPKREARWGAFLDETVATLADNDVDLSILAGRKVFLDREGELLEAQEDGEPVYLGQAEVGRSKRASKLAPPRALKRRIHFVHEDVKPSPTVRAALIGKGLVKEYDPVAVLEKLPALLAAKPKETTLVQVLEWAFQVWSAMPKDAAKAVRAANLRIPRGEGWGLAGESLFSERWTEDGKRLEAVCRDLRGRSPEMVGLAETFVAAPDDPRWPRGRDDTNRDWLDFLDAAGVTDGLTATNCVAEANGWANYLWKPLFEGSRHAQPGLGKTWTDAFSASFAYPQSRYDICRGQIVRLPGQDDHGLLSDPGKLDYAMLVLSFLKRTGAQHLTFAIAPPYKSDTRNFPTPAGAFLSQVGWFPSIGGATPARFVRLSFVWWRRNRIRDIPRVVRRPDEDIRSALDDATLSLLFERLGLNDWHSPASAGTKIWMLAGLVDNGLVAETDRGPVRTASAEAWNDLISTETRLAKSAKIVCTRGGRLVTVAADKADTAPTIYVADTRGRFETRLLTELDQLVLEAEAPAKVVDRLVQSGFKAQLAEDADVKVMIGEEPFTPNADTERLLGEGRAWLADLAVLALDVEGRGLAAQISRPQFRTALAKVRLVFAETARVTLADRPLPAQRGAFLAIRDGEYPTIVAVGLQSLSWDELAELGRALERLVDRRADGALRFCFMALAKIMVRSAFTRPADETVAYALGWPVERVREVSFDTASANEHAQDYLVPAVCCAMGLAVAEDLVTTIQEAEGVFDAVPWLTRAGLVHELGVDGFVAACREAEDRDGLRRRLGFGLAAFNQALRDLGRELLENRADLIGQFHHHLERLRASLVDRLRGLHADDFDLDRSLEIYVERRGLDFLTFDETWVETQEAVDAALVEARANALFGDLYGDSPSKALEPLADLRPRNHKEFGSAVEMAMSVVPAWCVAKGVDLSAAWEGQKLDVVRLVEGGGLLDFVFVARDEAPALLRRAGLWPLGMPEKLDAKELGLTLDDLTHGERQRQAARRIADRKTRQITFLDQDYDGASEEELEQLALAIRQEMEANADRKERFLEASLLEQEETKTRRDPRSSRKRTPKTREKRMTDVQRAAVGYAGEVRALEWIRWKYRLSEDVARAAWVSRYRRTGLAIEDGQDTLGYDFEVTLGSGRRIQYEVKASTHDPQAFDLGSTEVAAALEAGSRRRGVAEYRILYVPFVTNSDKWRIVELPNPLAADTRKQFVELGQTGLKFGFEPQDMTPSRRTRADAKEVRAGEGGA